MKKNILVLVWALLISQASFAQLYFTQTGKTSFFSKTPLEDISAVNNAVSSILNTATNDIAVRMNINQFRFPNRLMEEHFNENYLESEKFPAATFKGKISEKIDFTKEGTYDVTAKGVMMIHGVSKEKVITGKLTVGKDNISVDTNFEIVLVDYKIDVPKLVWEKIAEKIAVKNNFSLIKK
ncbi:YceI family protein [Arcicella sp. DC2W]|uniref:YceI family protein n=1 Tax=Arcicella gelida TaxID=2984195 RepID=A0ABU5S1Y7_9BACT|nr:YceI family protein [Arcicella sp. DC2W]MEA5402401.1 YceI family protein [Arcicella sp. DC2W]